MAIKGKSKARGRRMVTPGPRPTYVPVKRPFLQRRSTWIGVGIVLVLASALGVWYGVAKERSRERDEALRQRMREAATELLGKIEPVLAPLGAPLPPFGFSAFPEFKEAVGGLTDDSAGSKATTNLARSTASRARLAIEELSDVDPLPLVRAKGFSEGFINYVLNTRERLLRALEVYEQAARLVVQAADAEGDLSTQLVAAAKDLLEIANALFDAGYSDYIQVQAEAGVLVTGPPVPPEGLG